MIVVNILTILPPIENIPSGDDLEDTARINQFVERCIQIYPDQYLWAHRRFKTRPEGEEDLYRSVGIHKQVQYRKYKCAFFEIR